MNRAPNRRHSNKRQPVRQQSGSRQPIRQQSDRVRQDRIQKQKLRRRRKRILIIKRIVWLCILCCIGLFLYNKLNKNDDQSIYVTDNLTNMESDSESAEYSVQPERKDEREISLPQQNLNEELGIDIFSPVKYEGASLQNRLKELSEKSDEFRQIYENQGSYPPKLLNSVCNNAEMIDFVLGYGESRTDSESELTKDEKNSDFPLFLQWDKRWGYEPYGDTVLGVSGCAPTCISMVVFALTGNDNATPDKVAEYATENDYYLQGTGTKWSFLTQGARHYGIRGREITLSESKITSELRNGHPIICSMKPGIFTAAGHFIVLTGMKDGKIIVNDPNSIEKSERLWDYATIADEIKNLWVYSVK